jgi:hypothetical protein
MVSLFYFRFGGRLGDSKDLCKSQKISCHLSIVLPTIEIDFLGSVGSHG